MDRDKIDSKYKWKLEDIYKNLDEYNKDIESLAKMVTEFETYKDRIFTTSVVGWDGVKHIGKDKNGKKDFSEIINYKYKLWLFKIRNILIVFREMI